MIIGRKILVAFLVLASIESGCGDDTTPDTAAATGIDGSVQRDAPVLGDSIAEALLSEVGNAGNEAAGPVDSPLHHDGGAAPDGAAIDGGAIAPVDVASSSEGGLTEAGPLPISQNAEVKALLGGKRVAEIVVRGNEIWFAYTFPCTTCPVDPARSSIPYSYGLVVVTAEGTTKSFAAMGENGYRSLRVGSQGKLFAAIFGPDVTHGIVNLDPLLEDGAKLSDLQPFCTGHVGEFVIDHDGSFWAVDYIGNLSECKGPTTSLVRYDRTNSPLPTDLVHGVVVDGNGDKWVGLDFTGPNSTPTGLMRISGQDWQLIPVAGIPALAPFQYVSPRCADRQGNFWVSGFQPYPATAPNLVRHSGGAWISDGDGGVLCDSAGRAWKVLATWQGSTTDGSGSYVVRGVAYFDEGKWNDVDPSWPATGSFTLNVYQGTLVFGTSAGLEFMKAP